jgi:murein DD-endopeptidase MepM/ murein hydrolase activator NlpD
LCSRKSSTKKILRKSIFAFLLLLTIVSCKKTEPKTILEKTKPEPIVVDFGFTLNNFDVIRDTIKKGDTFGNIIEKQNLDSRKVPEIIQKIKDSIDVRTIRKGKAYTMLRSKDALKKLQVFIYQPDRLNYFVIDFRDSILHVFKKQKPLKFKTRTIAGELNGSLSSTLKSKGIDASLSNKLIKVYAWSIDFFKSKKGDKFALTFSERFINDTIYDGIDSLKAAFFEYKGKKIYAFPFVQDTAKGKIDYYDDEAKALRNFFLKAPLKFVNITSKFTKNRFHPVQMIWKAHSGTDYAAPQGTPIMTTATGIVEQTGYTAGNGNFVKVKHDATYSTQYLHMSKILVRRGQSIKQGDIIGKVGSTGLATGPHVCYRFWKKGVQVDALKLKLPNSEPMNAKNKPRFMNYMLPLKRELDSISELK